MKFEKGVTINLGGSETLHLKVSDAESFQVCDEELEKEANRYDRWMSSKVCTLLGKE